MCPPLDAAAGLSPPLLGSGNNHRRIVAIWANVRKVVVRCPAASANLLWKADVGSLLRVVLQLQLCTSVDLLLNAIIKGDY